MTLKSKKSPSKTQSLYTLGLFFATLQAFLSACGEMGFSTSERQVTTKGNPSNSATSPEPDAPADSAEPNSNTVAGVKGTGGSDQNDADEAGANATNRQDNGSTSLGTDTNDLGGDTNGNSEPSASETRFTDDSNRSLSSDDLRLIAACLKQWPNHPFNAGTTYRVRKISTSFSFGGVTLAGNDSPTAEPKLVLMKTSINLNFPGITGMAEYNFMNPNGYYCLSDQINVLADVRMNLHCTAHLASGERQFNVLTATNGSVSRNQVSILSNVFVYRICQ